MTVRRTFPILDGRALAGRRGIALIMVLWVVTLLALIAASFSSTTRSELELARNLVDGAKAEALAEAGLYQAILGLSGQGAGPSGDPGGAQPWRVDGTIYAWRFGAGEVRVAIEDEGGKIDLNASQDEILRGLFRTITLDDDGRTLDGLEADSLADAIIDFRDEDSLRHVNGAEDRDYDAAGLEHDAKDEPFELVEELTQVLGMTQEIYRAVAPALTVHSRRRRPFTSTAPPAVLAALEGGLGDAAGGEELAVQRVGQPVPGTEPEVVSLEALTETPQIIELGPSEARSRIQVYTIHSEGRAGSGAVYALETVIRLLRKAGQPYLVLGWRRAGRELFIDGVGAAVEPEE